MSDFRLEVFYTVAKRLSFTKAAASLFITQPAVTKHIRELEEQYKSKLFERKGNNIKLTNAGILLMEHAEELFAIYRTIDFDMNTLANKREGHLRLGASTTIAQYVIPPLLAGFRKKFPEIQLKMWNGNTEQIEKHLLNKEIEFGVVEERSRHQEIQYTDFIKDEIVLVCNKDHPLVRSGEIEPEQLKKWTFVLREQGSGTSEVIDHALKSVGMKLVDLPLEIELGSTESIKSYLLNSNALAFISIYSLLKELQTGALRVVGVKGLSIERTFYYINLKGKPDGIVEMFLRYSRQQRNLK